jgi:hypothetical protein
MKLAAKLSQVMAKVGYVQKGGTISAQGYKYVMASDVADKVRTALGELNVIMVPAAVDVISEGTTPSGKQTIVTARYTWRFIDGDTGESLDIQTLGSGADSGDKHVYKSSTGALKYALLTAFLIPTGDDPENDSGDANVAKAAERIFGDSVKTAAKPTTKSAALEEVDF